MCAYISLFIFYGIMVVGDINKELTLQSTVITNHSIELLESGDNYRFAFAAPNSIITFPEAIQYDEENNQQSLLNRYCGYNDFHWDTLEDYYVEPSLEINELLAFSNNASSTFLDIDNLVNRNEINPLFTQLVQSMDSNIGIRPNTVSEKIWQDWYNDLSYVEPHWFVVRQLTVIDHDDNNSESSSLKIACLIRYTI